MADTEISELAAMDAPLGMVCPRCGSATSVKDSRPNASGSSIRRRRSCDRVECGFRYSTFEIAIDTELGLSGEGINDLLVTLRRDMDRLYAAMTNMQEPVVNAIGRIETLQRASEIIAGGRRG